jgi:hypothetical protein
MATAKGTDSHHNKEGGLTVQRRVSPWFQGFAVWSALGAHTVSP